jgi:hypothetical protein
MAEASSVDPRQCVITFAFCRALVPETNGKHLEDIQAVFQQRVACRGA